MSPLNPTEAANFGKLMIAIALSRQGCDRGFVGR
jgi:hypothetical protein